MPNRKEILHELDHQVADADWCDNDWKDNVPIWMLNGALALLREQEPEIVRCKDCKHYDPGIQLCHNGLDGIFLPDWFCADGERR